MTTYTTHRVVDESGKTWYFEWHDFGGPQLLTKAGEVAKRQPGPKSKFWVPFQVWFDHEHKPKRQNDC